MSSQLHFSGDDVSRIRASWSDIQSNNRYHRDTFISRLYANLNAANPQLKDVINEDSVSEHSMLFGDVLSYTVTFLGDGDEFDRFMQLFCEENAKFVDSTTKYLEAMGTALMQTLKQWLGGKLQVDLENLWIKLYIFVANQLLSHSSDSDSASDVGSTFSNRDSIHETEESEEEDIAPLNIKSKQTSPPIDESTEAPVEESTFQYDDHVMSEAVSKEHEDVKSQNEVEIPRAQESVFDVKPAYKVVSFDLSKNDKYRGFRRSVHFNTPVSEQITIPVPEAPKVPRVYSEEDDTVIFEDTNRLSSLNTASTSSLNSFDPRRLKRESSIMSGGRSSTFTPRRFDDEDINSKQSTSTEDSTAFAETNYVESDFQEPVITPRSSKRHQSVNSLPSVDSIQNSQSSSSTHESKTDLRKLKFDMPSRKIVDTPEDEFKKDNNKSFGFDPRKSLAKRLSLGASTLQSLEDSTDFDEDIVTTSDSLSQRMKEERSNSVSVELEPKSSALKGLAPIVETDYDDASSKYDSSDDDDVSSSNYSNNGRGRVISDSDDVSSNDSSLSLHNSDYRSSISSGTEASSNNSPLIGNFRKEFPTHKTNVSDISSIGGYNAQSLTTRSLASRSTSSLLTSKNPDQMKNRVSMGFMRSSFVLKKEMEEMGFNVPENVLTKPPTIPAAQSQKGSRETLTSSSSDSDCFDLINSFNVEAPAKTRVRKSKLISPSTPNLNGGQSGAFGYTPVVMEPPHKVRAAEEKKIKRKFSLSSLFSRKKKSSAKTKNISAPVQNMSAYQSQADLASVCTVETNRSSISGFSFFSRRKASVDTRYSVYGAHSKSDSKYQIKSVPYKIFA